ncbi:MAG: glycosyltransferase WbuB, partial [Planctomycetes bacterium]|nr:glycosyltransferase WbuB [Planctomycetota bacterium]
GETGTLFRADDPASLVEAVRRTVEGRAGWEAQRLRGRAYVEHERTWDRSVANYAPIYESLVTASGR